MFFDDFYETCIEPSDSYQGYLKNRTILKYFLKGFKLKNRSDIKIQREENEKQPV